LNNPSVRAIIAGVEARVLLAPLNSSVRLLEAAMKFSLAVLSLVAVMTLPLAAQSGRPLIVQTNSAGDSVMLIDPATEQIVKEIPDAEVIHGAAVAPDGSRLYLSDEHLSTVDVVDTKTMRITNRIPLSGHPNNIAIHKNGRRAYVAITGAQGGIDVIDLVGETRAKTIRVLGGVHNPFITPDSKYVVAGSTGGAVAMVIDTETELPSWSIHFEGGVRPIAFEKNADGSTKRMFVQITNLHGFAIVDWEQRKEVGRIMLPEIPEAQRNKDGIQGSPAHGLLIAPDGKTLWSTSKFNSAVYVYSIPDLKYLGEVKVGTVPDWLTFTPDSKKLYVANAHDNTVSVIDVAARKELTRIKVGQVPKRNITAVLPAFTSTN
jgi:YVTN family beta-propeller protein